VVRETGEEEEHASLYSACGVESLACGVAWELVFFFEGTRGSWWEF
jgi:hypothetical protein